MGNQEHNQNQNVELMRGDRIRIKGSRFWVHNTTGTVVSVEKYAVGPNGPWSYGIEFNADWPGRYEDGYQKWAQWSDGGTVEKLSPEPKERAK